MQINYCDFPEDALYDLDNNVWVRLRSKKVMPYGIFNLTLKPSRRSREHADPPAKV